MDDDPLLTVPEIGKKLRVTEWTVREWIKTGKLHGWRAGMRRYRVPQSEFKRFLREREAPGPQTQEAVRTRVTGLGSPMTVDHALPQIHTAENRWHQTLAQHRQAPPDRGFAARLADQADACRKMEKAHASLAEFGLTFDPLPPGIREPPYELRSDSGRGGPPELWERFDRATVKLSEAWQGTSVQTIADAFGELARTLTLLARAVAEQHDVPVPNPPEIPNVPDAPPSAARYST